MLPGMRRIALLLAVTGFILVGCTAQNGAATDPSVAPATALTYYQDAAPIFAARCASCHSPGNIAPFSLVTYSDAMTYASLIKPAIQNHLMPPMPPDTGDGSGCPQIDDVRVMPDSERDTLVAWVDGGALAGDEATAAPTPPAPDALGAPTATYDSGVDYESAFQGQDEYRCFVIDPQLGATFNLIAVGVHSTNPAIVHHTIVYAQLPQYQAAVDALDAADPLPGYQCFGGPGWTGAIEIGAAAVGSLPKPFPNGSGAPLPAGTRYVVQVHYNFDNGRGSNRIAVQAWSAPTLTQVPHGLGTANYTFDIPAGAVGRDGHRDGRVHHDARRRQPDPAGPFVVGVPPHAPDRQRHSRRLDPRRRLQVVPHRHPQVGLPLAGRLSVHAADQGRRRRPAADDLRLRQLGRAPAHRQRPGAAAQGRALWRGLDGRDVSRRLHAHRLLTGERR